MVIHSSSRGLCRLYEIEKKTRTTSPSMMSKRIRLFYQCEIMHRANEAIVHLQSLRIDPCGQISITAWLISTRVVSELTRITVDILQELHWYLSVWYAAIIIHQQ